MMIKQIKILLLALVATGFFAFYSKDNKLVGHWVTSGPVKANLDFTADSFKVIVNGATENEGIYTLNSNNFSMFDNNCGMKLEGKYTLTFFTRDSVAFNLLSDSCTERSSEVNHGIIVRLK